MEVGWEFLMLEVGWGLPIPSSIPSNESHGVFWKGDRGWVVFAPFCWGVLGVEGPCVLFRAVFVGWVVGGLWWVLFGRMDGGKGIFCGPFRCEFLVCSWGGWGVPHGWWPPGRL